MSERRARPLIWIVDDSPTEAAITRRSLGNEYDFEYLADGAIAVERLTSHPLQPDVLLLDWVMPGMAGDEVCRFLRRREHTKELPIIIVTGSRLETTDLVHGLASGANDYVARPFAPEELRARVRTVIRSKQLVDASKREGVRLAAVNRLAQELLKASSVGQILEALASSLVGSLCDGCGVLLLPDQLDQPLVACHRFDPSGGVLAPIASVADPGVHAFASSDEARKELPSAYAEYIRRFGLRGLAILTLPPSSPVQGIVTLTRDLHSQPFDPDDIKTIEACLEFCALAVQNAMRFDIERVGRAQLHAVLESLPVGIVVTDAGGGLTLANASAIELIPGIDRARDLAGVYRLATWRTVAGAPIAEDAWVVRHALHSERPARAELVMRPPDGVERMVEVSGIPLVDSRSAMVGSVTVIADVSAERAVAAERERIARFQEELLAVVGHDLRNPLSALTAGNDLLGLLAAGNQDLRPVIDRLRASTSRMVEIVDKLLDVTQARLGNGIPVQPRVTPLAPVIKNVVDELSLAHPDTRFEMKVIDEASGMWDPDRLAQVVANLMSNAAHYGRPGGPVVVELAGTTISVRNPVDKPIPKDIQAALFEPFKRGGGRSRNTGGLGLGLYIVSEIVRAHGGSIEVSSDEAGTEFKVSLAKHTRT